MKSRHTLTVNSVNKLTPQAVKINFDIPEKLKNDFSFIPGQYIVIESIVNAKIEKRSYSICSSTKNTDSISVGVKQIKNGVVSTYFNEILMAGDSLEVYPPEGLFLLENTSTELVFIAGGSGITPILSMIDFALNTSSQKVSLYYSCQDEASTMFYDELREYEAQFPNFNLQFNFTQKGASRIDEAKTKKWLSTHSNTSQVFVCGPNEIIIGAEKAFESLNWDKINFKREYFTAKDESEMESAQVGDNTNAPLGSDEKAQIEIRYEGQKYNFDCKYNESILDAALNAGANPPYSCLVAACSTCRAMVKEGNIEMKDRDALSDKDIEKGFVLTCQSLPRSKNIILDYDV